MVEIIFLGTGSAIPTRKRSHSSLWLRHESINMLFDCGEGTQMQIAKAKLNFMKIDRIFITHWHADHWAGLIGLIQTMNMEGRKRPLYIHGPEADRFVRDILDLGYWSVGFPVIPQEVPYEGDDISTVVEEAGFSVTSIPVEHSVPAVSYAFKVADRWNVDINKAEKLYGLRQGPSVGKLKKNGEIVYRGKKITMKEVSVLKKGPKIVYSGDTSPCDNVIKIAEGADILIHDSTFFREIEDRRHSGAMEAAEIAKKAGVKKLILTHFSRRYTTTKELEEEARKMFKNTVAAKDMMTIKV